MPVDVSEITAHPSMMAYNLTCECGSREWGVILNNQTLDDIRDITGFICVRCGDSMYFNPEDYAVLN